MGIKSWPSIHWLKILSLNNLQALHYVAIFIVVHDHSQDKSLHSSLVDSPCDMLNNFIIFVILLSYTCII